MTTTTEPTPATNVVEPTAIPAGQQPEDAPRRQPVKLLRRSRDDRMLSGVCAGIATYFDIDPTLVRVAFVLFGLIPPIGGTLLLAYIAMALIVPVEDAAPAAAREQVKQNLTSLRDDVVGVAQKVRAAVDGGSLTPSQGAEDPGTKTPAKAA